MMARGVLDHGQYEAGPDQSQPTNLNGTSGDHFITRHARLLVALTVLAAIALDLFFFTGFYASDDREYFWAAANVSAFGQLSETPRTGQTRLALLGWNILAGLATQFNVQAIAASYICWHVALLLVTYVFATRVFDRRTALIAAYLIATFPLFIIFSTGIYPDLLLAFFFMLAVLSFQVAFSVRRRGSRVWPFLLMTASGLCIGFAYTSKESGLIALPFFFFAWLLTEWMDRRAFFQGRQSNTNIESSRIEYATVSSAKSTSWFVRLLTGAGFALGFFAVAGAEYKLLNYLSNRNDFRRLDELTGKEENLATHGNFHKDGGYNPQLRFEASMRELSSDYFPGPMKWAVLGSLIAYPFVSRRYWPVYFFAIWTYAFLTWGTYSFKHYYPPRIQARYYIPVAPFFLLILASVIAWGAGFIDRLTSSARARKAIWGVATALIVLAPAGWMRGPNHLAGKLYRADFVRNMARTILDASNQQRRLIVIGQRIAERVAPQWYRAFPREPYGRRPEGIVAANEIGLENLSPVTQSGGFFYIQLPKYLTKQAAIRPRPGLDSYLAAALTPGLSYSMISSRQSEPSGEIQVYSSLVPKDLGIIAIGSYEFHPIRVARYAKDYRTRISELRHRFMNLHGFASGSFKATDKLDLYFFSALAVNEAQTNMTSQQMLSWQPADSFMSQLKSDSEGEAQFEIQDHAGSTLFWPAVDDKRIDPIQCAVDKRYILRIKASVADSIKANLVVRVFSDEPNSEELATHHVPLITSITELGVYAAEQAVRIVPWIEVEGKGVMALGPLEVKSRIVDHASPIALASPPVAVSD